MSTIPASFWRVQHETEQVSWNYADIYEWLLTQRTSVAGVLVHIFMLEGSVHDAQCVVTAQLQQEASIIIYMCIAMSANHASTSFPNVCI